MEMESNNRMPLVTSEYRTLLICFNEEEITREEQTLYTYDYCRVSKTPLDRGILIDAIIRSRYSASEIEAILNNYLMTSRTEEHVQEFNEMQGWRQTAHTIADQVLQEITNIA